LISQNDNKYAADVKASKTDNAGQSLDFQQKIGLPGHEIHSVNLSQTGWVGPKSERVGQNNSGLYTGLYTVWGIKNTNFFVITSTILN